MEIKKIGDDLFTGMGIASLLITAPQKIAAFAEGLFEVSSIRWIQSPTMMKANRYLAPLGAMSLVWNAIEAGKEIKNGNDKAENWLLLFGAFLGALGTVCRILPNSRAIANMTAIGGSCLNGANLLLLTRDYQEHKISTATLIFTLTLFHGFDSRQYQSAGQSLRRVGMRGARNQALSVNTHLDSKIEALDPAVQAGQAVYNKRVLFIYDTLVLRISNPAIWRCPTFRLRRMYNRHLTSNHLDVGVGTGYFLDHCRFPHSSPRVALMDLNMNSLNGAADRIRRYHPERYQRNVLEPIDFDQARFDSIGMNYLLHCLPGNMAQKESAFRNLTALLNPNGVLFGSTILGKGVQINPAARRLMSFYNKKGIFSNTEDDLKTLQEILARNFREHQIEVRGSVALFWGRV